MACRINRQRVWAFRLELESRLHASSVVVTLTYETAPEGDCLVPRDAVLWLKRLRRALSPARFRYFLVGEYGEESTRPHYHAILFGFPLMPDHVRDAMCTCQTCATIRSTWGLGRVLVDTFSRASARYVCGYVTKKLQKRKDSRLAGRPPEFTRQSLRPGIGRDAIPLIAETVTELQRAAGLVNLLDVPTALRSGGGMQPLGRYLVGNLRETLGRSAKTPALVKEHRAAEMHAMSESLGTAKAFSQAASQTRQRARQLIAKHRLYNQKDSL